MLRTLALTLAVLLFAITAGRVVRSWPRDAHLGYAEGIWIGLAVDASHGVLYRPLDGPQGIGGSRYLPLYYLVVAAGITVGLTPIVAGYLTTAVSFGVLIGGVFLLLRRLGVDRALAIAACAAALACQPLQMALLSTRGDALAAGLAMLGLAVCITAPRGWGAPLLFALAIATKPTSAYAPLAAMAALWINGAAGDGRRLGWRTFAGLAALVVVFVFASGGRMLGILAASGGGGAGLSTVFAAPISALHILRRVPESAFFMLAGGAILIASVRSRLSIHQTAWITCLAVTLAIYASPGTIENHLLDLTVLSIVAIAVWAAQEPRWATLAVSLLVAGGIAAGGSALWRSQREDVIDRRELRREVLAALADAPPPILFDQPMLAVQRGDAPYILDQYVSSIRFARDPGAIETLAKDVEAGKFGAVVFENLAVDLSIADAFPGEAGVRFRAALERAYALTAVVSGRPIYRPKSGR